MCSGGRRYVQRVRFGDHGGAWVHAAVGGREVEAKSGTKRAPCIKPPLILWWLCGV